MIETNVLREKVLDLAIRGKLVPQDPNDEPASVLLERIRAEKQQMVKDGKLKAKDIKNDTIIFKGEDNLHYEKFQDGTVKCIEDEIPFEVPEGWSWARLKHICMMAAGKAKPSDQIKPEPYEGCYPCFGGNGIRGYVDDYNQNGTFSIVGRQGALCGNINIASGKFYATEHAVVTTLFEGIDFNWSNYTLEALRLNEYATGAAQPGLSVANVLNVFVPVPPTHEQIHIGHQIAKSIRIIESITDEKSDLQTLISLAKSKILDLAIHGQLIPLDPNDEPASVLLERIRAEKEELIKQGKIKRDKKESIIFKGEDNSYYEKIGTEVRCIDNELPFELPDSWTFVRLKHIGEIIGGGTPKTNISEYWDGNIPWLTPADFSGYEEMYVSSGTRTITEIGRKSSSAQMLPANSVLYSSRAPIGYIAIAANPVSTNQGFKSVVPYDFTMSPYLYYCLKARTDNIIQRATGTTFKEISGSEMAETIIPLPPITEQKRIFEKATQLFNVITMIEESLN